MSDKKINLTSEDSRVRSWTFLVYPDSAPDDWESILDSNHIQWAHSPLHEHDVNADGSLKKPHWHCLVCFEGKKSFEQVCKMLEPVNSPIPKPCNSARGMIRYFTHMDNPEKYQYSTTGIKSFGGMDLEEFLRPTSSSRYNSIKEMMLFCSNEGISEFSQLCDYALANRYDDWFPLLCDNSAFIMKEYLKSFHFSAFSSK